MPTLVLLWVWLCAYLNCAGWMLSAFDALNTAGYATALVIFAISVYVGWHAVEEKPVLHFNWRRNLCRFRKPFPLAFLVLSALAALGGILYPPTNYDALAYRIPRILHWLDAGQWHWIHTIFDRVNARSCGIEWVSAPVIALLHTDRPLFLINAISFLLLPGLVFSVFTRLGVRRKVAWHWMWIVPTGYCFLLQAGSIGNDLFGVPFALAAVDFALRAKSSGLKRYFYSSILAAAMMTSGKMSNLPLLLPWALAILPSWKTIFRPAAIFVYVIAIFASALPTMYFNQKLCGDWSGAGLIRKPAVEHAAVLRTGANAVLLVIENFVPPIFPTADKWNSAVEKMIPIGLENKLLQLIELPGCKFSVSQMQIEENAGLGFGVCVLLLASVIAAALERRRNFHAESVWIKWVRWSPMISLLAVMTQSNVSSPTRTIPAYYVLLVPIVLMNGGHELLVRKIWWRAAAFTVFFIAAVLLIISPARPLFPAQTILQKLREQSPTSSLLARANAVYFVYQNRNDAFAPARDALPPDLKILGLITSDDPETSLWRPFGSRRIIHVCPDDTAATLRGEGIRYILLPKESFTLWFGCPLESWLNRVDGEIVKTIPLNLRAARGTADWYLVKLY